MRSKWCVLVARSQSRYGVFQNESGLKERAERLSNRVVFSFSARMKRGCHLISIVPPESGGNTVDGAVDATSTSSVFCVSGQDAAKRLGEEGCKYLKIVVRRGSALRRSIHGSAEYA